MFIRESSSRVLIITVDQFYLRQDLQTQGKLALVSLNPKKFIFFKC